MLESTSAQLLDLLPPIPRLKLFFKVKERRRTGNEICDFGLAIKMLIERYNNHHADHMTDERLAGLIPVAKSSMSFFINGQRIPHYQHTEKICDVLECTFTEKVDLMRLVHQSPQVWYEEAQRQLSDGAQLYIDVHIEEIREIQENERFTGPLPSLLADLPQALYTENVPSVVIRTTEPLPSYGAPPSSQHHQVSSTLEERTRPSFTSSSSEFLGIEPSRDTPPS